MLLLESAFNIYLSLQATIHFLPAACGMVMGWVVMFFFFLLGHLAFGLTFYQPHSDMVLDRVELLGKDL